MARVQEFYKGRRKRRNLAIVPFIVLLLLVSLVLVLFYGMQKYAVITKDGVTVELPILMDENAKVDELGHEIRELEQTTAEIVFEQADYSDVEPVAGKGLSGVRAIFVPAENISHDELVAYASRLVSGNALLLEMKPRNGAPMWYTNATLAQMYGIGPMSTEANSIQEYVNMLKEQGVYLAAQISCCVDETLPARTIAYCLQSNMRGIFRDETGTWLDPYNPDVREYIAQMAQELFDMGFDEVVLADVAHPALEATKDGSENPEQFIYTTEISTQRSAVNAVCGFALSVAEKLSDREGVLSIYLDSRTALVKPDTQTGQDGELFLKVFDRAYLKTDKYAYPYNADDIKPHVYIGSVYDRLVPVVENYIPSDNSSWILIDVEEE